MAGTEKGREVENKYTINPDHMQALIDSLDNTELTDAQKCGHILEFFKQKKVIKNVAIDPRDMYHRDANAATTPGGGSIDFSAQERKGGS